MAKKEFTFKGKTLEELKALSREEFITLLDSRSRRSLKRGYPEETKKAEEKILSKDRVKTHSRELVVVPGMVGKTVLVHNGKQFVEIRITEEMLGHRLGEFSLTRNTVKHSSPGVGATRSSGALSVR
jgi:small subunit ribosomal protein S19